MRRAGTCLFPATLCGKASLVALEPGCVPACCSRCPSLIGPLQPVMVIGNVSCVLGVLGFGLATSYRQAMAARAVGGALNAIILAEKAMLGRGAA